MILEWRAKSKTFKLQKLVISAGPTFKSGYAEAVVIKNLLRKAGGYKIGDVRIVAVARLGVLQAHNDEHGVYARKHMKAILKVVKEARTLNQKKPAKGIKSKSKGGADSSVLRIRD